MIPRRLRPLIHPLRHYYYPLIGKRIELPQSETSARLLYPKFINSTDNVIEVGARTGGGTLLLSELANHVYSFEPIRFSFRMLRQNTRKCQNVTSYNYAVGNMNGEATLNLPIGQEHPYVASTKKLIGYEYRRRQRVKMLKLDDVSFPLKPTSLVIDCEGHEAEVLDGAKNLLPNLRNVLIETHTLSDGTETLPAVRSKLAKYANIFEIDTSFVDEERQRWILAKVFLQLLNVERIVG